MFEQTREILEIWIFAAKYLKPFMLKCELFLTFYFSQGRKL